jgi:hypothetical protein
MMVRELLKRLEKLNKIKKQYRKPAIQKTQAVENASRSNRKRDKTNFLSLSIYFQN